MENNETKILIKHLEELRKKAVKEHPTDDFKKYWSYYSGISEQGKEATQKKSSNKYNIIKGIIDTKTTLILYNEIVSTVMPRLKTFVDSDGLALQNDIADILRDINAFVLDNNGWERIKSQVVKNKLIYGVAYTETVWKQDDEDKLGDVAINALNPMNCYPDAAAKELKDCNYFFIKESFSPITLKKKYPEYAKKMQTTMDKDSQNSQDKEPTGIFTTKNDGQTAQFYSYNEDSISESKQKNITVWKCYLKDDSTFVAKESDPNATPEEIEMQFKYPHGRMLVYVDGAKDYILEDKPIDYPFGFPIDVFSSSTDSIFGDSAIKYLLEIQDRINRAWDRVRYLVAAYLSLTIISPRLCNEPDDLVNQSIFIPDSDASLADGVSTFTNNTLSELTTMLQYIDKLKQTAYEIARTNPMMISGERPDGITSGTQIAMLNESPMLAIKEEQRHFKYFVCEQGKKNIVLIQLYYNTPRMIRLTNSKQIAEIPATIDQDNPENMGLNQQPMRILEQKTDSETKKVYYEAIREIQGDLSIGEYDMQVIAGTEMPRSRTERAQITMQLADKGLLGNNKVDIANMVLTSLDFPLRHQIIDKMTQEQDEMSKIPSAEPPTKDIQVNFKDFDNMAKAEWYQNNGFPQAAAYLQTAQKENLEHLKEVKQLIKE